MFSECAKAHLVDEAMNKIFLIRKVPKFLFAGIFACLFSLYGYSQSIGTDFLDTETYSSLSQNGKLINFITLENPKKSGSKPERGTSHVADLKLVPDLPAAKNNVVRWANEREDLPNYVLENLYVFKKNPDNFSDKNAEFGKVNTLIRQFSKLKGVKYYSHSRHKMDVLYPNCYTIESVQNPIPIPDVTDFSVNPLYVLFDDNSFGVYIGEIDYGQNETEIFLTEINQNSLGLPGIKAIKSKDLMAFIDIVPCKDEVIVYVLIEAKVSVSPIFKNMIYESFIARSDAIFGWIKDSY